MKKRIIMIYVVCSMALAMLLTGCGSNSDKLVLNVYNWGEFIADGTDGTMDIVSEFEDWYEEEYGVPVQVNYSTFSSNEDMYNKISTGAVSYDIIVPSDYMIARMAEEGLLQPINFDNIPNYQYIDEEFRNLYYDPDNMYSIPYAYGIVGILYDANVVAEEDIGGWDILWNEKYSNKILQYNNSRDALGTAMYMLDIDVNTTDKTEWDRAYYALEKQRPLVKSYVMDEIYNMMQAGEAAVASYYVGDYLMMRDARAEHVDLQFYYPEPTNFYVDAMCIPTSAQNKELAEIFINFLLSEEVAIENAEYIYCSIPNSLVYENEDYIEYMGEEVMELLYPEMDSFVELYNKYAYRNLDAETLDYINTLWEKVKIN